VLNTDIIALVGTTLFPVTTTFFTVGFSTTSKDKLIFPLVTLASGLTSANYDIQKIYIDGILKIVNVGEDKLLPFLEKIEKIANRTETEVIVSATIQDEEAKKSLAKYIIEE